MQTLNFAWLFPLRKTKILHNKWTAKQMHEEILVSLPKNEFIIKKISLTMFQAHFNFHLLLQLIVVQKDS